VHCHDCKEEIEHSVCIGIASNHTTLALLHFCSPCFLANAGPDYIELMWAEAAKVMDDDEKKEAIIKKLAKLS